MKGKMATAETISSVHTYVFRKNEKGITLVALIITIIVLVILAAVSVYSLIEDKFLEVASNTLINYTEKQLEEENELNKLDKKAKNAIEKITGSSSQDEESEKFILKNIALEKDIGETVGSWIKVKAMAVGKENESLKYTLKIWKKENEKVNEDKLIQETPTKIGVKHDARSGEEIELVIDGLEEYTEYLYRVEVSDKKITTEGQIGKVRTFCSGKR